MIKYIYTFFFVNKLLILTKLLIHINLSKCNIFFYKNSILKYHKHKLKGINKSKWKFCLFQVNLTRWGKIMW